MNAPPACIGPVRSEPADDGSSTVSATLSLAGADHDVWWRVVGARAAPRPEACFTVLLQAAMSVGAEIHVDAGLSGRLLDALPELQSIWRNFDPHLQTVQVQAPRTEPKPPAAGVGLCFSLGVDGFHSLVTRMDEVTHLVLIHGIDYPHDTSFSEEVAAHARAVADVTGKTLVEITTNASGLSEAYRLSKRMTSGQAVLGGALAAAGIVLEPEIGRLYVPSSATAATLIPFGSHPLTDPLWSIDTLDVVHDAIGVERIDKVAALAGFEPAFAHLRPCGGRAEPYNCGRCRKCAHTMFMLEAVGALDRFDAFPTTLEEAIKSAKIGLRLAPVPGMWFDSLLEAVKRMEPDSRAARKLKQTLRSSSVLGREHRRQMRRVIKRILRRVARKRAES